MKFTIHFKSIEGNINGLVQCKVCETSISKETTATLRGHDLETSKLIPWQLLCTSCTMNLLKKLHSQGAFNG